MAEMVHWQARPVLSRLLRLGVLLVPLGCAAGANVLLSRALPRPAAAGAALGWWVLAIAASTLTMLTVYRLTRRLLPLAVLLDLSLAFPESAPSRWDMARRQPNVKSLQARLSSLQGSELERSAAIVNLAVALSAHDSRTRGHSERVRLFTEMLGAELHLSAEERDRLRWAALLHDIGKLTVPRDILNKPGRPDEREWAVLREHPREGARIVGELMPWFGSELGGAVLHHHEKFDGSGYPAGLSAEGISLGGRIVAVADAFEVMTAARPYKRPMPPQAARRELVAQAGAQFDPAIVRAFLGVSLGRLWMAIGPSALLAQVPLLAQLPERLGGAFTPATGAAASVAASVAVGATLTATGALAAAPSGPWTVYAVNDLASSNSVSAFSTAGGHVLTTIPVGSIPLGIAVTPDGRRAYVVSDGANTIMPIDLTAKPPRPLSPISTGSSGSNWIAITPDGRLALVTDPGGGKVTPFDLTTDPPTRGPLISAGVHPEGIAITPDGRTAWVADAGANGVIPIDLTRAQPVAGRPVTSGSFNQPFGIAITPDGTRALVTNRNGSTVTPVYLTRPPIAAGAPIAVGKGPVWIAVTPDGRTALVTNGDSGTVTPIALSSLSPQPTIPVGGSPYAIAVTPDGRTAYVTDGGGNTVRPIDLTVSPPAPGAPIVVGSYPRGLAIGP